MPAKLSAGPRLVGDARLQAGLSRGPTLRKKLPAAAWSNTWPAPGATLDLDFANNRGFVRGVGQGGAMDAITFTRASSGTYVDSTGTVQTAGNNAARFDWASTTRTGSGTAAAPYVQPLSAASSCNGLLIEESRANRLLWCRDATNAAWTKTNVNPLKDQTGIDGVANAASSLTASADGGTCIQQITLASGSRTSSVFLKRITGTGNVQFSQDNGTTWATVDLSNGLWNRIIVSATVTNPTVGIKLATNGDAVALDYGQVEDGAFATSPVLTTTASATRAVDSISLQGQNFYSWFNYQKGTFLHVGMSLDPSSTAFKYTVGFACNGTSVNSISIYAQNGASGLMTVYTPSASAQTVNSVYSYGSRTRTAISYNFSRNVYQGGGTSSVISGSANFNVNGTASQTEGTGANPVSVWNTCVPMQMGCINRLAFIPAYSNPSQLSALTGSVA